MTDQVSGIEMEDEDKKIGHLTSIRAASGITEEEIKDRVEIFERVQWAFHSELVGIFTSLQVCSLVNFSIGEWYDGWTQWYTLWAETMCQGEALPLNKTG